MAIRERRKRIYRKRIPYGMQNFEDIRERDCYYVDKTPFIEDIEDSNMYFFYIRPRRFGKSLTLSMLEHYYDINKKDKFESLFGGLYIGENPTPEHNTYLIIHLNFAEVDAGIDNYQSGLDVHCNIMFNSFCNQYAHLLPPDAKEGLNREIGAIGQLRYLCQVCKEANQKIYLFIDEYDNFTNTILANEEHLERYRNQTHGEGYLRRFFNTIKGAAGSALGRVFVTGVSPVTMDDLTSGFNIGTNYSLTPQFNEMTGFTEEEVREMLGYYSSVLPFNHTECCVSHARFEKSHTERHEIISECYVEEGFLNFLLPLYCSAGDRSAFMVDEFVKDVEAGHVEQFMNRLTAFFADNSYQVAGEAELYFQNALYLIFKIMGFHTQVEIPTSDGRMDVLIQTSDYIYIIECKLDGSAEEALQQIEVKNYAAPFAMDKRTVVKLGINFSSKTRGVESWKQR